MKIILLKNYLQPLKSYAYTLLFDFLYFRALNMRVLINLTV